MKYIYAIFMIFFLFMLNSPAKTTITLAIDDWPPYTSTTDQNNSLTEIIVREAFELEDIEIKIEYLPWVRSYEDASNGLIVGTFPWFKTDHRENEFIFPKEGIFTAKHVFFYRKDKKFEWETYEDLKKYRIGSLMGTIAIELLGKKGITIQTTRQVEQNHHKLLMDRIDAFSSNNFVGYYYANLLFSKEEAAMFTHHPKPLIEGKMYILISKKIPNGQEIADRFDNGIRKLKASGRYDEILSKFPQ